MITIALRPSAHSPRSTRVVSRLRFRMVHVVLAVASVAGAGLVAATSLAGGSSPDVPAEVPVEVGPPSSLEILSALAAAHADQ